MAVLVFCSQGFSESIAVADTTFSLLSNTDQCLTDCEAWIEWDLSERTSDVLLPTEANQEFKFELVKKNEKTKDLLDFGVEVYQYKSSEVPDYCWQDEEFLFGKENLLHFDGNAFSSAIDQTCADYGCEDRDKDNCVCTKPVLEECGSHTEMQWEKVGDFFDFEAEKGEKYRLRVWGKKKASVGSTGIDWQPTFFGETISKWAWWDSDWDYKKKITLKTSDMNILSNITTDHPILVDFNSDQSDFWSNVNSAGADVRFTNSAEGTEYKFYFQEWNYAGERMIAWVKVTDTFPAASNLDLYIYYGNSGASDAQDAANTLSDYGAVWHLDEGSGDVADNIEGTAASDLYIAESPKWTDTNAFLGDYGLDMAGKGWLVRDALWDTWPTNWSISYWYRPNYDYTYMNVNSYPLNKRKDAGGNDQVTHRITQAGGERDILTVKTTGGSGDDIEDVTSAPFYPLQGRWYYYMLTYDNGSSQVYHYRGENGLDLNFLNVWSVGEVQATDGNFYFGNDEWEASNTIIEGTMDEIKLIAGYRTPDEVELIYQSERGNLQAYESEEINTASPDTNVLHPTNNETFTSGNTIDINISVSDIDSNAQGITINLSYSTVQTEGTGISICTDCNLSTDFICDSNNLATAQECKYSWSTTGVSANNYYILAKVFDPENNNDFNAGTGTFTIKKGKIRINADLNLTKTLNVTQDANFLGNVKIEGTLFGGSPVKMKGGINVEGGILSDDYKYTTPENTQVSLIDQIKSVLESIQKLFHQNNEQDQRISILENELCKHNKKYSWCN